MWHSWNCDFSLGWQRKACKYVAFENHLKADFCSGWSSYLDTWEQLDERERTASEYTDQEALYHCTCLRFLSNYRLVSTPGLAFSCLHHRCSRSDTNGDLSFCTELSVVSLDTHIHSGRESGLSVLSFPERSQICKESLKDLPSSSVYRTDVKCQQFNKGVAKCGLFLC